MTQPDLFGPPAAVPRKPKPGRELAERGAQLALDKAQRSTDDAFLAAALRFFVHYVASANRPVSMPEVRMWSASIVPAVREPRAWGPIPVLAKKLGYVVFAGHVASPDPRSHARPCAAWRWTGKVFA